MNTKAPTSPQDFKKKRPVGIMLDLPSGNVIKVKSVDLVSLVVSGKIPNSLLTTVQEHLKDVDPDQVTEQEAADFAAKMSPEELAQTFSVMDSLVIAMAMEPKVHPVPEDEGQRDEELLYVDELDGEDKLFMFNWSQKGLKQTQRFPEQAGERLDALEEGGEPALPTGGLAGVPSSEL